MVSPSASPLVVVVDDEPAVCDALTMILTASGFTVESFASGTAFVDTARHLTPACVLLDVNMRPLSGLEVLAALRGTGDPAPVIMITGYGDIATAVAAIKAGAHDFLEKPFTSEAVLERVRDAVRVRSEGKSQSGTLPAFPGAETLTARERGVLDEIVRGLSNKETGRALGISPRTVEVHRARIMEKLGARNTADLMRIVLGG